MRGFAGLIFIVTALGVAPVAQQPKVRTVPHQKAPIESLLRPDDQIVEMDYWADVMYVGHGDETHEQTVYRMAHDSDAIAVVKVTEVEPMLVEGESWIRTRVVGIAEDVVKGRRDKFEALIDGGEMIIKGVQVKASSYPVLRPGSRYLAFVVHSGGEIPWLLDVFSFEDRKAVVRPEWPRAENLPVNPFAKQSPQQAIAELKKALR